MRTNTAICLIASLFFSVTTLADESKRTYYSLSELKDVKVRQQLVSDGEEALRIESIRERAEEVGSANGYIATMERLTDVVDSKSHLFDRLLPFEHLINASANLSSGEAKYLRPGMVDKVEAHAAITRDTKATIIRTDNLVYRLREQPKPVLRKPHWSDYLYDKNSLTPTTLIDELLPRNSEELEIFNSALDEGWAMGSEQAIAEMRTRVINAFIDATAMIRYVNLVESGYIEKPDMIIENVGITVQGDQLGLGTQFISLSGEAVWQTNSDLYSSPVIKDPRGSVRRDAVSKVETEGLTHDQIKSILVEE
ncbi:type IV secretory system conjugative DNA transfer family protein [Vibrio parahaemolyticus]|uniref:Type IV secretory system conjugative DNA transfer family protein n=4 Tax=Vibrionaceae TaxID=641 RepID=A0AA92LUJ9_9VIBR|nr:MULTISPECIES: type IV secretory system conjugative DNA transfer family protein [Vibrio]EJG1066187.1 type IV secretory system conjugative DNA transfer family protein [Vibrio parahaemolyticus O1]MCR9845840.1 type IV secretory system conjugative DNA transfer family protein [Vibrio antiquarius]MDW1807608.1 type IV secretory system conjugative DNA transfer family protein [Vibrio sp. Vb2362]MDW2297840.1 type IV secretory system conjugative DNA transfer family protein [Vibrio sp. 1404]OOH98785.1 h